MEEFIIWAAGFFDGEGSITINRPHYALVVGISNSDKSVLEAFRQRYKGYLNRTNKAGDDVLKGKYKHNIDCYQFIFEYDATAAFLYAVLPHLRVKKAQAELALEYIATIKSLASLRGGRRGGKRMTGIERQARIEFYHKMQTIRKCGCLFAPVAFVNPQMALFGQN